ncbi:MAG: DNRLRE domain-containing protein, partial [Kofleriaceae bacterium]|nr:DNRLRE domain-containing protein [Kofleriaceae bacterium]
MQLRRGWSREVVAFAIAAASGACAESDDVGAVESAVTATFQTGVDEYVGTLDGEISNRGGPNGSTDMDSPTARIMRSKHPANEYAALVKFTNLSLPPGAIVTSAALTLTFDDDLGGHSVRGYYVSRGWNGSHVGWGLRDTGMWWNTPGAKGMGTDVIAAPAFVDADWSGAGTVRRTYALDVEKVQKWIDDPSTNRGVLLSNNVQPSNGSLRMHTAESVASENRPQLTIQYTVSDGAVITLAASAHPRIWMDAQVLQRMRDRAMAADARWVALRAVCNSYLPGVVRAPNPVKCQDSCSGSTICCGFQGESYYPALLNLGLCYQIGRRLTPADPSTTAWAQKGAAVLAQMVTFTNY